MQKISTNKLRENTINFLSFEWLAKYHLHLFSIIIISIITLKLDYLNIPLYWDETIYFVPALFHKGLEVFKPSNYLLYEWHGHPPLFQLEHYFISNFFRNLTFSGHLTALINFIFFLSSFYYVLLKNFSWKVAIFTVLSFIMYPHVIAQSTMFHPNFLMIGAGLLSIQYYLDKKWGLYVLMTLICVLTRESAVAFSFVIFLHSVYQYKRYNFKFKDFKYICVPVTALFLFLAYNKYVDGHLFAHPYFKNRVKDGFSFLNFLNHNYNTVWEALKNATWSTWSYPSIILIIISFLFFIKKKTESVSLSDFDIIFISTSLCFLAFYTLYADTIVRDFLFISVVFVTYNIYFFNTLFKRTIWVVFFTFFLFITSTSYHHGVIGVDTSLRENRLKPKLLKEVGQFISKRYSSKVTIGTGWPLYNLLRDPLYGYSNKKFETSFDRENQQVLVNTNLNAGFNKDYQVDSKIWKKVYSKKVKFHEVLYYIITIEVFEKRTLQKGLIND